MPPPFTDTPVYVVERSVTLYVIGEAIDTGVAVVPPGMVYEGVTVTVAVTGVVPVFTPVKEGILPVPLAARPMDVLLFVQL